MVRCLRTILSIAALAVFVPTVVGAQSGAASVTGLACAVPYYGGGITMGNPSPLSRTGEIKCPMYLFFGAKDQLIPMDQVGQINTELTTKKVPFQMKIYPDAGHGFLFQHHDEFGADVTAFLDADRETV